MSNHHPLPAGTIIRHCEDPTCPQYVETAKTCVTGAHYHIEPPPPPSAVVTLFAQDPTRACGQCGTAVPSKTVIWQVANLLDSIASGRPLPREWLEQVAREYAAKLRGPHPL